MDTHHSQAALCQGLSIVQIRASTLLAFQQENLHPQELRDHTEQGQAYQALKLVIAEGFPSVKASLPDSVKRFWSVKDHLSINNDLIVYGCCLLIPTSLHTTMLSRLHNAHQLALRQEPASPYTGLESIRTLKRISRAAATVRIAYHPMPKNQW